jgi:hypothetical protein
MSTPFFSLVMGRIDNLQFEQLVGARKAKFSAPSSRPAYRTISIVNTPSVSFYKSLNSAILHYPATYKKKRRE